MSPSVLGAFKRLAGHKFWILQLKPYIAAQSHKFPDCIAECFFVLRSLKLRGAEAGVATWWSGR